MYNPFKPEKPAAAPAGPLTLATVGTVSEEGVTLILPGASEPTQAHYPNFSSSSLESGDSVIISRVSGTWVVMGKAGGGGGGGGGGGSSDYNDLSNKPSINNVTLSGNKTASDLGLRTAAAQDAIDAAQDAEIAGTILGNLAYINVNPTADKLYNKGDYLVYNGQLYKVTAAIAAGETLTVGTNIESTDVANIFMNSPAKTIIDAYNGYVKFDSGFMIQWGRTVYADGIPANGTARTTVTLNIPFASTAYFSTVNFHTIYPHTRFVSVTSQTINDMSVTVGNSTSSAVTVSLYIYWLCIGFWK